METFDVVVVGAGLAGLECAGGLARAGLRVLLVEARPALDRGIHTTGIFVRRTFDDFPFPEGSLGPAVRRVVLYSPSAKRLELESARDEFRVGRMAQVYRARLTAAREAGVVWSCGTLFRGTEWGPSGATVWLERRGAIRAVGTGYLVGADGARSRVAGALGLDENRAWLVGVEDVLDGVPLEGPPVFHCFLDPALTPGYIGWLVNDGESAHLGVGGDPDRFEPLPALEALRARAAHVVGLGRPTRLERRGGRIPVNGVLRRIANRRGLLVGDAAGAVSPLTAGGLDGCLRLTRLAVAVIVAYLGGGRADALEDYSGERFRRRYAGRLLLRRAYSLLESRLLMEASLGLLRLAPFRRLAEHVFFGPGSFPDVPDPLPEISRYVRARSCRSRLPSPAAPARVLPRPEENVVR